MSRIILPAFLRDMRTLFCNTPYGTGGIGQHFAQLVTDSRRDSCLDRYYAFSVAPGDSNGHVVSKSTYGLLTYTPLRFLPGWKSYVDKDLFDRRLARRLAADDQFTSDRLMGFVGSALRTFEVGRSIGVDTLELVAANSHVDNVTRLHAQAAADSGIHDSWLNEWQRRKTLREYERADRIYVHSEYVRHSFLDAGVSASKLVRTVLAPDPRFVPPTERPTDDTFRIVYVGRLEATKGIALLLDAFDRLSHPDIELVLVGGWSTRMGRRLIQSRMAADPRITLRPGDPLPVLQQADVFVHPSYEDGFGYAPMEALACGVPVIVTADTGMKEYVEEGTNGFVVPTGSIGALNTALDTVFRSPLAQTASLLPPLHVPERDAVETVHSSS
jgi:glycosyltransferase involved in cell wall biosynthesis